MKDHKGCVRAFYLYSECWYGPSQLATSKSIDEVSFGMFEGEGGTSGEMAVRWTEVGGHPTPRLECFDDGWSALASFPDVIAAMGELDSEDITPKDFCQLLLDCGFVDKTPRENPYAAKGQDQKPLTRVQMLEKALADAIDVYSELGFTSDRIENAKRLLPSAKEVSPV